MYIDPGSRLLLMQVIAAAVLTAAYKLGRLFIARFTARRDKAPN